MDAAAELAALKAEVALLRSAAAAAPTAAPAAEAAEAACDWAGESRWTLTQEELGWCAELVAALAAECIMRPAPDLLLAQFAIAGKGETTAVVEQVKNYNRVIIRQWGYKTAADHLESVPGFTAGGVSRRWPGILAPALPQLGGKACVTVNASKLLVEELLAFREDLAWCVTEALVFFECASCDLDEIRKGFIYMSQSRGIGWKNFSLKFEQLLAPLYDNCYPLHYADYEWQVDAPFLIRAMMKLLQQFISRAELSRVKVCSQDELYETHGYDRAGMPPFLGGTYTGDYTEDWLKPRLAKRAESVLRVKVP